MKTRESVVLVTGGLGYIGGHVVDDLLARGWRVRILDNHYRSDPRVEQRLSGYSEVEIIEGDVRYPNTVDRVMPGVEGVVHLAAVCINKSISEPAESLDVNLVGSQNVFDAAARHGVRRLVFASSASVYGNPTSMPMYEDSVLAPITPYCIAKAASEQLLKFYGSRSRMAWVALRFFNVYGPGQPTDAYYTSVILTFLRRMMAGEPPVIDGDGAQSMDFVHVADVARAVGMALDSEVTGEILNVGTGRQTTVAELAHSLAGAVGMDITPQFRPREVLVTQREASVERIHDVLNWQPEVEMAEGLASVVEHMRATGALAGDSAAAGIG